MPSYTPVESVRRALAVLKELNRHRVASVDQLHRSTGIPKPSIVRLLETLQSSGLVMNDRRQGGYQVTSQVLSLSCGFHGDPLVVEAGRPWAIEFTRRHQWPVSIAVLDSDAAVVRFSTIPDSPVSPFHGTVNMRLRLLTRALGRAYLAFCPAEERNLVLGMLARSPHPEDEEAKDPGSALVMLEMVRRAGYADRSPLVEPKSSSTIAVPVQQADKVLATVGFTYFRSALGTSEALARYLEPLQRMAEGISASVSKLSAQ